MGDTSQNNEDKDYFELGISELDSGNFKKAIQAFKKAIKINPDDQRVYNNLGIAYELSHDLEKARSAYEKAIEINPQNSSILNNLAGLALLEGKPQNAAFLFDSAISADPMYIEPYMNVARMFIEMREFLSAEPYVLKVLEIEPENAEAHNLMGVITSITERSEEAVTHFQSSIKSDANQASVFSNLGTALRNIGDRKRAIIAFEKSNELNPNSLSILNNLGVLYRETSSIDTAKLFFERAIKYYPDYPFPYLNMAELYLAVEDYDKALENLKKYSSIVPLDMDTLFKTCGIARMANKLSDVTEEMHIFVEESEPDDPRSKTIKEWLKSIRKKKSGMSKKTNKK
ncbi:tetratricopeptide repeat protein [Candidatus Latescibacterota bacterium]